MFPTPDAWKWVERRLGGRVKIAALFIASTFVSSSIAYLDMKNADVDALFIVMTILFDCLVMFFIIYFLIRSSQNLRAVLPKVRGREVEFYDSYLEIAGTILTIPSYTEVLKKQHPYLRLEYVNIDKVVLTTSQPNVSFRMKNGKLVVLLKIHFKGCEAEFARALESHQVKIATS